MRFTKHNNPSKKRAHKKISREDADIIATINRLKDEEKGIELPPSFYEHQSDVMSGKPSRHIYD